MNYTSYMSFEPRIKLDNDRLISSGLYLHFGLKLFKSVGIEHLFFLFSSISDDHENQSDRLEF